MLRDSNRRGANRFAVGPSGRPLTLSGRAAVLLLIIVAALYVCAPLTVLRLQSDHTGTMGDADAYATATDEDGQAGSETHSSQSAKLLALTFDDGPSAKATDRILKVLKKHKVRATFFVVGESVLMNPDVVKRTYEAGMLIGSHTHTHQLLTKLSPDEIFDEIQRCADAVYNACGFEPTLLRPPGGAFNETVQGVVHMPMIQWSLDTRDWITKDPEDIYQHLVRQAKDGGIVLMHDTVSATADALERAIPKLKKMGYRFVTVDELYDLRGIQLTGGTIHYACPILKGVDRDAGGVASD